jgi:hypothetical protein
MARGAKTGGRQKGTPNRKTAELQAKVEAEGITPLAYMLSIMRNDAVEATRRDDMAKAAAAYIHAKLAAVEHSGNMTFTHEDALNELDAP